MNRQSIASKRAFCRLLANGDVGCWNYRAGPETGFDNRYGAIVAGHRVRPRSCPKGGYTTPEDAVAGAAEYRDACKREVATGYPHFQYKKRQKP